MPVQYKIHGLTPFTMTNEMRRLCSEFSKGGYDELEIAKNIFSWMHSNVRYDYKIMEFWTRVLKGYKYKSAHEVFGNRKGVCLDQGYLYTCFARESGLESNIVEVYKDNSGKDVCHACSSVIIDGDVYLVDPAYNSFDIIHQRYKILSDDEAVSEYFALNHSYSNSGEADLTLEDKRAELLFRIEKKKLEKIVEEEVVNERNADVVCSDDFHKQEEGCVCNEQVDVGESKHDPVLGGVDYNSERKWTTMKPKENTSFGKKLFGLGMFCGGSFLLYNLILKYNFEFERMYIDFKDFIGL